MNAPQNPSSSHSESAPEQADLNQLDDLLDDLLHLQDEAPVLSPFLAIREDRGIPELELEVEPESPDELAAEISDPAETLENALPTDSSELETIASETEAQELAPEKHDTALSLPTPLNVRLQSEPREANPQEASDSFFDSLLENPASTVLSSTELNPVEAVSESNSEQPETSSYQDIHKALAKPGKTPFLASPKLWLVLALVGLGAGGGIALWQKANQPRVSFSLSGQDLGTDFLEPDPFVSASSSSGASSVPSAEASIVSFASPSVVTSAGSSASPSPKPSAAASATTELLLWARINQASVNIRSAPGKQASVVLQPKINQKFILTGQSKRADDLDWAELQLDESKTAWVSTRFIEISPGEKVATKPSPAPVVAESSQPSEASQDEYAQAAKVVAQLLKAPGTVWPQATPELQNLSVLAMLKQIFKDKPDDVTPQRIATLQSCLDESARAENLKKLKVYEIAVACTLALNWR